MKYKYTILAWIPALLCLLAIFYLSSENSEQSNRFSMKVTNDIIDNVPKSSPPMLLEDTPLLYRMNDAVRKAGHIIEYMFLSFFLMIPMHNKYIRRWKLPTINFLICFIYSVSDELHQINVAGRAAEISDLILDNIGIILGILSFYGLKLFMRAILQRNWMKKFISAAIK